MTNKQTIDGVSRDAILWLLKHNPVLCQKSGLDTPELRALLDTPETVKQWVSIEAFNRVSTELEELKAAPHQGEIERLQKEVARKTHCYQVERANGTELRAQLAEQDALLSIINRKASEYACASIPASRECRFGEDIAALSTSAEPKP